jgi:hypothetical protein
LWLHVRIATVSRRLGLGEGSIIGGRVTLALAPDASAQLACGRRVRAARAALRGWFPRLAARTVGPPRDARARSVTGAVP